MDETDVVESTIEATHDAASQGASAGESGAAAGNDMEGVATGQGAVAAGGSISGTNIASGDGAVAFDGANKGNINTGSSAPEPSAAETVTVSTVTVETVSTVSAEAEPPPPAPEVSVIEPEPVPAPVPPEPGKLEEARVVVEQAFEKLFTDEAEAIRYLSDPPAWLAFDAVDPEVAITVEFGQMLVEVAQDMTAPPAGPEVSSNVPPQVPPAPSAPPQAQPPVPTPDDPPFDDPESEAETPLDPPLSADAPPMVVVEQTVTRHVVEVFEDSPEVGGIMADGSADGAVVGHGNTVNNVFDAEPEPSDFGAGDAAEPDVPMVDDPSPDLGMTGFGEGAGIPPLVEPKADAHALERVERLDHDEPDAIGGLEAVPFEPVVFEGSVFEGSVEESEAADEPAPAEPAPVELDLGEEILDE